MYPTIPPGNIIITDPRVDMQQIKIGDLITYIYSSSAGFESYYTHRVINIYNNPLTGSIEFVTKGDGNPRRDRYRVTSDEYIGRAIDAGPPIVGM